MRIPDSLAPLAEYGVIQEVIRPLTSGKEAQIYLVISNGQERVAKVYKEAQNRAFKNRAEYTEGRRTRNSRDQRAMEKRSSHGRAKDEEEWRTTEVEMIRRLHRAGVRVPVPYQLMDGVLIMELIADENGDPAPRLGDLNLDAEEALAIYEKLLRAVVRMLCAGVIHGDLSDFNVLLAADGPVIIDFPQAVEASSNPNARKLLVRDVDNLHRFLERFSPRSRRIPYAEEMWEVYERNALTPDTPLLGTYKAPAGQANTGLVLEMIDEAERDERFRREGLGPPPRGGSRRSRQPMGAPRGPRTTEPERQRGGGGGGASQGARPASHAAPPPAPARPRKLSLTESLARAAAQVADRAEVARKEGLARSSRQDAAPRAPAPPRHAAGDAPSRQARPAHPGRPAHPARPAPRPAGRPPERPPQQRQDAPRDVRGPVPRQDRGPAPRDSRPPVAPAAPQREGPAQPGGDPARKRRRRKRRPPGGAP